MSSTRFVKGPTLLIAALLSLSTVFSERNSEADRFQRTPPILIADTKIIPALINPVSPRDFGAKCDGLTDDSHAFQAAINASDVKVPPGICIINKTVEITVSNRHLECSPGTTLKQTDAYAGRMFNVLSKTGGKLSGNSIVKCNLVGANTAAPQYFDDDARHFNIAVQTQDRVSNFVLVGNTIGRFFGQALFQTYGQVDGGSGDVVAYNVFNSCGYYGAVFVAHRNGYIGHNVLNDCAVGIENDDANQMSGGNIIEYNTITAIHGYGAPDMRGSVMLTGGAAGNADYSTNVVRYNSVSGTSDSSAFQGAGRPSLIYQKSSGIAAQYMHNFCGVGCRVID